LEDKFDEELFAHQKKQTERTMKIVIALIAGVFLFVLYYLIQNGWASHEKSSSQWLHPSKLRNYFHPPRWMMMQLTRSIMMQQRPSASIKMY